MIEANNLYQNIINVLINILKNDKLRKAVIENKEFNENVINLTGDLLALEQDYSANYENEKYSRTFIQTLANLTNKEIKIIKEDDLSLETITDNLNFIKTYILNIYKISLTTMSATNIINSKEIQKLSEIKSEVLLSELNQVDNNSENKANNFINNQNVNLNPKNLNDLNNNLQNILNLPQSPLTNQTFYPYTSKPKIIPILKLIIGYSFAFLTILITILTIYGFINKIDLVNPPRTKDGTVIDRTFYRAIEIATANFILYTAIIQIAMFSLMSYFFLKPVPMIRDRYRIQPVWLIIAIIFLLFFSIFDSVGFFSENSFRRVIGQRFDSYENSKEILDTIWKDPNFQVYRYLRITFSVISLIPIIVIFYTLLVNPRIDRQKLFQAQQEYQKAIAAAMRGEKYQVNPNLFDHELQQELDQQKRKENDKK